MSKKNYSLLLFDIRVAFNGKCPEKRYYTKKLEKSTGRKHQTFSHISVDGKKTLCGIDMEKANNKFNNKWEETKQIYKECDNCLRIYNMLERELNKPCVGQLYRHEKTFEVTKRGDIIEKVIYRHLKMDSCPGCDKCYGLKEYHPSEFIFPSNPIEGEVYQAKFYSSDHGGANYTMEDCDYSYVELTHLPKFEKE